MGVQVPSKSDFVIIVFQLDGGGGAVVGEDMGEDVIGSLIHEANVTVKKGVDVDWFNAWRTWLLMSMEMFMSSHYAHVDSVWWQTMFVVMALLWPWGMAGC